MKNKIVSNVSRKWIDKRARPESSTHATHARTNAIARARLRLIVFKCCAERKASPERCSTQFQYPHSHSHSPVRTHSYTFSHTLAETRVFGPLPLLFLQLYVFLRHIVATKHWIHYKFFDCRLIFSFEMNFQHSTTVLLPAPNSNSLFRRISCESCLLYVHVSLARAWYIDILS